MIIENDKAYIPMLAELWHKVFNDEKAYIDIFFDTVYSSCKTFAHFENGSIVSAFYLLDCKIRVDNKEFDGVYLYAAATDSRFRKRGIMSSLIEEAKSYCIKNEISFISLVPGAKELYNYYSNLGFQTAMYKNIAEAKSEAESGSTVNRCFAKTYLKSRQTALSNCFLWKEHELEYVFKCLEYSGICAYSGDGLAFIADKKSSCVKELLCSQSDLPRAFAEMSAMLGRNEFIFETPLDIGKRIPFGMIITFNESLKKEWSMNSIYMNLALD